MFSFYWTGSALIRFYSSEWIWHIRTIFVIDRMLSMIFLALGLVLRLSLRWVIFAVIWLSQLYLLEFHRQLMMSRLFFLSPTTVCCVYKILLMATATYWFARSTFSSAAASQLSWSQLGFFHWFCILIEGDIASIDMSGKKRWVVCVKRKSQITVPQPPPSLPTTISTKVLLFSP